MRATLPSRDATVAIITPSAPSHPKERRAPKKARGAVLARVPVSWFAIAVGVFGLGSAWRAASQLWMLPSAIGEGVMAIGAVTWLGISASYGGKWIFARTAARSEANHPIHGCFAALAPMSVMLAALAARPYAASLAHVLYWTGAIGQASFMVYRTGTLWGGGRDPQSTTPVLYLPAVAGSFVSAIVSAALGYHTMGMMLFGIGFFSWLALESVMWHRLLVGEPLVGPLLPTLGILLAPPVVGCAAYLGLTSGPVDQFALTLFGYGLLQASVLLRLAPRFRAQSFITSYWAFTFGVSGLALTAIRIAARAPTDTSGEGLRYFAALLFVTANVVVGTIVVRTILLAAHGRLLPPVVRETVPRG